jgi:hypothetical protein
LERGRKGKFGSEDAFVRKENGEMEVEVGIRGTQFRGRSFLNLLN